MCALNTSRVSLGDYFEATNASFVKVTVLWSDAKICELLSFSMSKTTAWQHAAVNSLSSHLIHICTNCVQVPNYCSKYCLNFLQLDSRFFFFILIQSEKQKSRGLKLQMLSDAFTDHIFQNPTTLFFIHTPPPAKHCLHQHFQILSHTIQNF